MAELQFNELESKPEPVGAKKLLIGDDRMLLRAGLALVVLVTVWRFYIGLISHVIWEESHFVVSGEYLALGYPDIPAGFPWLARLVTSIFGWHVWPLRIIALVIAGAIPFAVYFLSTPVTTRRNAIWAAILSMLLPPSALNGTIFYPEGALQLLLVLMTGCLIRAITDDKMKWWIWAGVCAGIGQLVHFRFLVPGLAMVVFMLVNRNGRALWTRPGPYITAAITALGLVPAIIYNASEGWPAIQFHVINRPRFDPSFDHIFSFVLTQVGIVTPLFFVAMVAAAKVSLVNDRDRPDALLGYQAVVIYAFYILQATINKKVMPHWPFMAYLPLLPYVPGILIAFADKRFEVDENLRYVVAAPVRFAILLWNNRLFRMALIATGPILALTLGIAASVYQWVYRHSSEMPAQVRQANMMKNENWSLLEPDLAAANARAQARFGSDIAWATSGHVSAVHMEFPGPGVKGRRIYTLDEPSDQVTRFVVARHDWGLDRAALLHDRAGKGIVLIMNEPDYVLHEGELLTMYTDLCRSLEDIEPFKVATLPPGRTALAMFTARVRNTPLATAPRPCPLLPQLYVANPGRARFIERNDTVNHYGMAVDPIGITHVDVLLDGKVVTPANYGLNPKDAEASTYLNYDPNYPNVQFDFHFPKGSLTPGEHELSIEATRTDGTKTQSPERILYVKE